jgi:putative addiction module component (TIGR02574 family)
VSGYTGRMTTPEQILEAALGLPVEEREQLVTALLESLDEEAGPLTEEERQELDRRLDAYHRNPEAASSLEEVMARLDERMGRG